ncbi:MAG: histidinol dehydrogenase [Acidimicrobiia bacterium]|nr:histidinol dehydrogenase [Acidimicrobiia bacterium]
MSRLRLLTVENTDDPALRDLLDRSVIPDPEVSRRVAEIISDVAKRGAEAATEYGDQLGGGYQRIDDESLNQAVSDLDHRLRAAIETAIESVETYQRSQMPADRTISPTPGVEIARRWTPLRRVGAYAPGGKAAYPSTVIMTVVPAVVAGVREIVLVSPAGPDGAVAPVTLAAARLSGATEVWSMGGAQAVAALAYGTEDLAPVDKIVGPGNHWVTAAKLAVLGKCAIDLPAGPSEVLVIADETSDPTLVAVDLLSQTEHGPDSPAVLVTTDPDLAGRVEVEIERLLPDLERSDILAKALSDHGSAVVVPDIETAVELANHYAPEHVTVLTSDAEVVGGAVTRAGSVYIGEWSPESAGDYATGANHVLPTGGLAASYGPLSVTDFGSWRQVQTLTGEGLENLEETITALSDAEGLTAHGLAAQIRVRKIKDGVE